MNVGVNILVGESVGEGVCRASEGSGSVEVAAAGVARVGAGVFVPGMGVSAAPGVQDTRSKAAAIRKGTEIAGLTCVFSALGGSDLISESFQV